MNASSAIIQISFRLFHRTGVSCIEILKYERSLLQLEVGTGP